MTAPDLVAEIAVEPAVDSVAALPAESAEERVAALLAEPVEERVAALVVWAAAGLVPVGCICFSRSHPAAWSNQHQQQVRAQEENSDQKQQTAQVSISYDISPGIELIAQFCSTNSTS